MTFGQRSKFTANVFQFDNLVLLSPDVPLLACKIKIAVFRGVVNLYVLYPI